MAGTSDLDVAYVARLARLNLTEDEAQIFQKQLDDVPKYAEKLRQLDVTGVDAAAHAPPVCNVFRDDSPRDSSTAEQALSNAPRPPNGLVVSPRVWERSRRACGW